MNWDEALALVTRGRKSKELVAIAGAHPQSVRNWLAGRNIPGAGRWRALVVGVGLEDRWAELSAARDAVAHKLPGRPRLTDEVYAAGVVARRRRKVQTPGAVDPQELQNER